MNQVLTDTKPRAILVHGDSSVLVVGAFADDVAHLIGALRIMH
jgi:UDP-N-acetylglucosamine 2-epimerase